MVDQNKESIISAPVIQIVTESTEEQGENLREDLHKIK